MEGFQIRHDAQSSFPFWELAGRSKSSQKSVKSLGLVAAFLACTSRMTIYERSQLSQLEGLGSGNTFYARAYRDDNTGKLVVVKSLRNRRTNSANSLDTSVLQELKVSVYPPLLKHSNITRTLGVVIDGSALQDAFSISLVVEYAELGSLEQYLAAKSSPQSSEGLQQRIHLIYNVCTGLEILHRCHIIHGDIKPDNVLLFQNPLPNAVSPYLAKLTDFGSSIVEDTVYEPIDADNEVALYRGTPLYVPHYVREYSGGLPFHAMPAADIYSLGLLMWTTLKGETFYDPQWDAQSKGVVEYLDEIGVNGVRQHFESDLQVLAPALSKMEIESISKAFMFCVTDVRIDNIPILPIDRERFYRDSFSSVINVRHILGQGRNTDEYHHLNTRWDQIPLLMQSVFLILRALLTSHSILELHHPKSVSDHVSTYTYVTNNVLRNRRTLMMYLGRYNINCLKSYRRESMTPVNQYSKGEERLFS